MELAVAKAVETTRISHVHRDCLDKHVASRSDQRETRRICYVSALSLRAAPVGPYALLGQRRWMVWRSVIA
jgi:hypothetical protein